MSIFVYEFVFYVASVFAAVVCIASGTLFFIAFRHERLTRSGWRTIGFFLLSVAFFFLILERKNPVFGLFGVLCEMGGTWAIYRGVMASPSLVQLAQEPGQEMTSQTFEELFMRAERQKATFASSYSSLLILLAAIFGVVNLLFIRLAPLNVLSTLQGIIFFIVLGTIMLQVERLGRERNVARATVHNTLPLIAYIFLLMREAAVFIFRLPPSDMVYFRQLTLEYSMAWQLGIFFTFAAFVFLGLWAWNFIKYRKFLRTYVIFLFLSVILATVGALIFTVQVFKIIEKNNLDLMTRGAETQQILLDDRQSLAMFVAQLVAGDEEFLGELKNGKWDAMKKRVTKYLENSGVDSIRVYNKFGEVVVSPADPRDLGRVFDKEPFLAYVITKKVQISTFDTESGVLTPVIVARAFRPLLFGDELIGAVEVSYKFDNAFVDYSKQQTGLDVSIYAGPRLSATTIKTVDGISRWVGSEEADPGVRDAVLGKGAAYSTMINRLDRIYYSAFKPIRDLNGQIIGMVSVGIVAQELFEATRQKLLTIFLVMTFLALLTALIAYRAVMISNAHKEAAPKKAGRTGN